MLDTLKEVRTIWKVTFFYELQLIDAWVLADIQQLCVDTEYSLEDWPLYLWVNSRLDWIL